MNRSARAAGAMAVLLLGGLLLAGCNNGRGQDVSTSGSSQRQFTDRTALGAPITALRLATTAGNVRVQVNANSTPSLRRDVQYEGARPGSTHRISDGTLSLFGCGEHCRVDYLLVLPTPVPITGSTSAGS